MKKIIPFTKDIPFNTKVSEITSISLEHTLKLERSDLISGEFIVSGDYKITDVSINQDQFYHSIPFSINLDDKYNIDNAKVDIDDFYYEIINEEVLRVNIDVLIDGIEVVNEFKHAEDDLVGSRGIDESRYDYEESLNEPEFEPERKIEDLFKEEETPPTPVFSASEEKIKSLFDNFDEKDETFTTYHIHVVRETDTIESISAKYNTTKDEVLIYNKIEELKLGDKLIIPAHKNE